MCVTVGRQDLKHTVVNGKKGDIECTSTKIKDENIGFSSSLVHTIGNSGGCRFVNNTINLQTSNSSSILGGLTLGIVEIGRDCDDSIVDGLTQECLSCGFHFLQDHGRNFFRSKGQNLAVLSNLNDRLVLIRDNLVRDQFLVRLHRLIIILSTNQSLNVKNCLFGVNGGLIFCGISYQTIAIIHKGNVRRSDTVTLVVRNNLYTTVFEHADTRVGCSKINTNYGSHLRFILRLDGEGVGQKGQSGYGKSAENHCRKLIFK
mmetsp:Transcript_8759/g.11625  ORF Transcript_8759/g.11625 Transcript_8759/m.11625 type:complete len:260 (-) Transcript_8759:61-840(-)